MDSEKKVGKRLLAFLSRNRYPLYAFGLVSMAFIIASVACGIAPFGTKSILVMDLWGQYYPMIEDKLAHPFAVWSWNGSLGFSSLVQNAYYTNSLFNFLLLPFHGFARIAALDVIAFLKAALSAGAFAYFLERRKDGKGSPLTVALGTAYGLSAYLIAFISQPMWLDAVLFLPLLLLGLERMLSGGRPWLYVIFLTLTLYSNFYIGFAVCIFTTLWFLITLFSDGNRRGVKGLLQDTGKFAFFSVASGMLAAFTLLPVVYGMQNWISASLGFEKGDSAFHPHKLWQIADNLSMGVKPSLEFGVANLYCGSAIFLFFMLFLLNRKVSWKKKAGYSALAVFMLLSFELKILDFIWHGLHFPNQLPGRQSFLFAFVMLVIAYETLSHLDGLRLPDICFSVLFAVCILMVGMKESKNGTGRLISIAIILLTALLLVLWLFLQKMKLQEMMGFLLAAFIALDSIAFGVYSLAEHGRYYDGKVYASVEPDIRAAAEKYESGKDTFYRTEMTNQFTFDPGMLYGFKGISFYSSTMNGHLYRTFENLGNRVYAKNVSSIYQPTPIQDMMFGVRYHYVRGDGLPSGYGKTIDRIGTVTVMENRYTLPFAYAVCRDLADFSTEGEKPFAVQNEFLRLATGMWDTPFMAEYDVRPVDMVNAEIYKSGGKQYYNSPKPSEDSVFVYGYAIKQDGLFYLDIDFLVGDYTLEINGIQKAQGSCGATPLRCGGFVKKGDEVTVKVTVRGYGVALCGVTGYVLDETALENAHSILSQGAFQVTKATDTRICGTMKIDGKGLVYTSIPAEKGWHVYADGKEVETFALDSSFLCFSLPEGEHQVEFRYKAPGFALGIGISALSVVLLAGYWFFFYRKKAV